MADWTIADIPDQTGRICVVTGASSGIGEEAAIALAGRGAQVVLAVRDQGRGDATRTRILARHPEASVTVSLLDLADLASVRAFAERTDASLPRVDLLLNNAGLGQQKVRTVTTDGFELQFATNYLGPFALTGLLLPVLLKADRPRVVAISSVVHRMGRIRFDDLQGERSYSGSQAYSQSKLADLMFALALDRRARQAHSRLVSVAAHPGIAATSFIAKLGLPPFAKTASDAFVGLVGHDSASGAMPGLYAATMPDMVGGQYVGLDGLLELKGAPAPGVIAARARDVSAQERLWAISERLTGVTYAALA